MDGLDHGVERFAHFGFEPLVHFLLGPEIPVTILYPFEIRRRHTAAVGQDVWNDEHTALVQVPVRLGRRRAVGAFDDDLCLDAAHVVFRDLVLDRGWYENVHGQREELVVADAFGAGEAINGLVRGRVLDERRDVQALCVVDAAAPIGDGDDLRAEFGDQLGSDGADVAETLDGDGRFREIETRVLRGFTRRDHHAAAGGFASSERAAELNGLAGDDGGFGVADVHAVGVHDPRHDLIVGVHVRRGYVLFWTDGIDDLGDV